jgi:hypothetical protein
MWTQDTCPAPDSDHDLTDEALDFDTIRAQLTVLTGSIRMRLWMMLGSRLAGIAWKEKGGTAQMGQFGSRKRSPQGSTDKNPGWS